MGQHDVTSDNGSNFVTVKLPGRDLGEFLTSMLGQRRTTSKDFNYIFTVDIGWVINFVDIIQQRVASQNDAQLITSSVDLLYDNGKQVKLNDIEQLRSYNDVSKDISFAISVNLVYLVKFPYKSSAERQDIIVTCKADTRNTLYKGNKNTILRSLLVPTGAERYTIRVELKHTDLSWAEDIINLASNHVDASFTQRSVIIETIKAYTSIYAPIAGFLLSMFSVMYRDNTGKIAKARFVEDHANLFNGSTDKIAGVEEKINIIFKYFMMVETATPKGIENFLITFLLPLIISVLLVVISRIDTPSYVILNQSSLNYATNATKKRKVIRALIWTGVITGMAVNLASTLIYDKLAAIF